jgi:hypothetical protein
VGGFILALISLYFSINAKNTSIHAENKVGKLEIEINNMKLGTNIINPNIEHLNIYQTVDEYSKKKGGKNHE